MFTLAASETLRGVAGSASAITYTITGDEKGVADAFKTLAQGQLPNATGTLYTVPVSTSTLIQAIFMRNTTAGIVSAAFYINGTAGANQIWAGVIPANGSALYGRDGWIIYDANGVKQYVGGIGPTGATGATGATGPTGPTGATGPSTLAFGVVTGNVGTATAEVSPDTIAITGTGSVSTNAADVPDTLVISNALATTSAAGNLSAADKLKLDNAWVDVTSNPYGTVTPAQTAAQNITGINAILAAAPAGSVIYFPGGSYNFNAAWTMPSKQFVFQGHGSNLTGGYSILAWTSNVAGDLITIAANQWYTQFRDLTFVSSGVTQSAGAVINVNGNVATNIMNCTFGVIGGGFLFNVLVGSGGSGSNSWNSAIISNCIIAGFKGVGIFVNSSGSSLMVTNCVIQGQWGPNSGSPAAAMATAGIEGRFVGALQLIGSDVLGCINNLLLDPILANGEVCASVFGTNTYFDNSGGSCIKISGTGATVRCRFDTCSFTTAGTNFTTPGTNLSAVEFSSTFAYTANGQGIDFVNCNVLNTFGTTGTTNGYVISGTADFSITASRIAAWTNGVQVTPIATAGRTRPVITGNTIGPTGDYAGNSVGILLNAGAAAYGSTVITGNCLTNNTSAPMTDNSAVGVTDDKLISNNAGYMAGAGQLPLLSSGGAAVINGRGAVTSGTANTFLFTCRVPPNSVAVGQKFRLRALTQTSAAGVPTFNIHLGAAGTIAGDAIICPVVLAAQATNSYQGVDVIVQVIALGPTATVVAHGRADGNAATGAAQTAAAELTPNVPTTAAWFITFAAACGTTGTITVRAASIEAL